jgi:hypothetical protein
MKIRHLVLSATALLWIGPEAHAGHEGKLLVGYVYLLGNAGLAAAGAATAALSALPRHDLAAGGVRPWALSRVQIGIGSLCVLFGATGVGLHHQLASGLGDAAGLHLGLSLVNLGLGGANLALSVGGSMSRFALGPLVSPDPHGGATAGLAVAYRGW